ncbi:MAG: 23S rRNA (adenine(2503)-C(2))-methyltransferase RlmN [Clostridiales bacterium]|nr:23S rRNA (adenine(2503)-C(2))-methyltransferase RlmN [Clostridiales bacterium]
MRLLNLSLDEIEQLVISLDEPKYRAKQLYSGLQAGKEIEEINISKELKQKLALNGHTVGGVTIHQKLISKIDGTIKYLYQLEDGNIIEGVLMHYKHGSTLCVSTQVGCRMHCAFCASTIGGLVRHLESGEILGQVIAANRDNYKENSRGVTNIVLMGSGEPLDNYDNVLKFLKLVSCENGLNISMRNISLSTCGLVDKIYQLAKEKLGITLSLSLHAPTDEKRKEIMPVSKAYNLKETIDAMHYYVKNTGRRVVFEYALIDQFNDTKECAVKLKQLVKGMQCHINLIPLNSVDESGLKGSKTDRVNAFKKMLEDQGLSVTIRREMGADISGACGQLRRSYLKKEDADWNTSV